MPVAERVYQLEASEGWVEWNIGLRIDSRATEPPGDALALRFFHGAQLQVEHSLQRDALRAHTRPMPDARVWQVTDLQFFEPSELDIDRVVIELREAGALRGRREVPIVTYQQRGRFRLPLDGCWLVSSGHAFGGEHRRWYNKSHFGWDLIKLDDADGMAPEKTDNAWHRAFGQAVLAPADGVVRLATDTFPDRPPGQPGPVQESNFILLDHGQGEHSKLAHLRQGSLLVQPGQHVRRGQPLARVGNSGRSDAPHLHLHFQTVTWTEGGEVAAEAPLPIALSDYLSTSNLGVRVPVALGRPRRGDIVCASGAP